MEATDVEPVDTECPVCNDKYSMPKILPCAHLLCRGCLVNWIQSSEEAECPLCRNPIADNTTLETISPEDIADSLPSDHSMSALVQISRIFEPQRVCFVHTTVDAVSICLHCRMMLCQPCVEYHRIFPITSSHKIKFLKTTTQDGLTALTLETLVTMTPEVMTTLTPENLATVTPEILAAHRQTSCSAHLDKTSELFCSSHGEPVCQRCATSKHRSCPEVIDLCKLLENCKISFSEMEEKLNMREGYLSEAALDFDNYLEESERNTNAASEEIDAMCDRLQGSVENCRHKLKMVLRNAHDNTKAVVTEAKSMIAKRRGMLTSHRLLLKRIQQTTSPSVQGTMVATLQERIHDLDSDRVLPANTKPMTIGMLTIDRDALSRVEEEMEMIGHVDLLYLSEHVNAWRFHTNHGDNVILTNSGQTAELKNDYGGIVMSSKPLKVNVLYEVRVDGIDVKDVGDNVIIGVVMENPSSMAVPCYATLFPSAIGIGKYHIRVNETRFETNVGEALRAIKAGDRVGVMVDDARCLHLYLDGKDQGVVYRDVQQPCYAFIDMWGVFTKVTALPFVREQ